MSTRSLTPCPAATEIAAKFSVPLYASLAELFEQDKPDGVILATPNNCTSRVVWSAWRPAFR